MNRTKNEDFNKLQTNVRHGIWDNETAQAFKSRELAPLTPAASASSLDGPEADYVPILVTRNRTRAALEFAQLRAISESAKTDLDLPIIIFAHMKTKRGARAITASEKAYLLGLPDSEFNKAAPYLALYPGARCVGDSEEYYSINPYGVLNVLYLCIYIWQYRRAIAKSDSEHY